MCGENCSQILIIFFGVAGSVMLLVGLIWYCYSVTYKQHSKGTRWSNSTASLVEPAKKGDYLKNIITDRFLYHAQIKDYTEQDMQELQEISLVNQDHCVICLMKYIQDPSQIFVGLLKNCGHYFHFECIWAWLQQKQTCPVCRKPCTLDEANLKGYSLEQVLQSISCSQDTTNCDTDGLEENSQCAEGSFPRGGHCGDVVVSDAVCTTAVHFSPSTGYGGVHRQVNITGASSLPDVEEKDTTLDCALHVNRESTSVTG